MSSTSGSVPDGSLRKGSTALAPGWRTISSVPVEPSGNRTVSTSRLMMRPVYSRVLLTFPAAVAPCVSPGDTLPLRVVFQYRAHVQLLQRCPNHGGIAHRHELQRIRMQMLAGHAQDIVARHGAHPLAIAVEVFGRQSIHDHRRERPRNRVGRLVLDGEDAIQIAHGERALVLG